MPFARCVVQDNDILLQTNLWLAMRSRESNVKHRNSDKSTDRMTAMGLEYQRIMHPVMLNVVFLRAISDGDSNHI